MNRQTATTPAPGGTVSDPPCGSDGFLVRPESALLCLALAGVDAARAQLDRYALKTDTPAWQAVDAADALDSAHDLLAKAVRHA